MTHMTTTLASTGTNYTAIGIVLAIFVPDLRGDRDHRLELLPAAAAPRRRGGDGLLPQARRGGGGQHDRAARRDGQADRARERRRAADAGRRMTPSLSLRRDPVRLLLSRGLWAGAWYLLAYQVIGWVLFAIALTAAAHRRGAQHHAGRASRC